MNKHTSTNDSAIYLDIAVRLYILLCLLLCIIVFPAYKWSLQVNLCAHSYMLGYVLGTRKLLTYPAKPYYYIGLILTLTIANIVWWDRPTFNLYHLIVVSTIALLSYIFVSSLGTTVIDVNE